MPREYGQLIEVNNKQKIKLTKCARNMIKYYLSQSDSHSHSESDSDFDERINDTFSDE